jgi:hypothetical protein
MEDLPRRAYGKGGSFFSVKGTYSFQVLSGAGKGHIAGDHVSDIHALTDMVNDVLRNEAVVHRRFRSCFVMSLTQPAVKYRNNDDRTH